jgi:hypothetical protein
MERGGESQHHPDLDSDPQLRKELLAVRNRLQSYSALVAQRLVAQRVAHLEVQYSIVQYSTV